MTTFQDAAVAVGARLITVTVQRVQKMKTCRLHILLDLDRQHLQVYQLEREREESQSEIRKITSGNDINPTEPSSSTGTSATGTFS